MSGINGVGGGLPIQGIVGQGITRSASTEASSTQSRASDRLELSGVSHLLQSLKSNDVRVDKVADIKAQIEAGMYEDDYKLDVAVGRLLDDISK
jgi:anti-sigma28 factor (negative regulator of flagellin synthesis)